LPWSRKCYRCQFPAAADVADSVTKVTGHRHYWRHQCLDVNTQPQGTMSSRRLADCQWMTSIFNSHTVAHQRQQRWIIPRLTYVQGEFKTLPTEFRSSSCSTTSPLSLLLATFITVFAWNGGWSMLTKCCGRQMSALLSYTFDMLLDRQPMDGVGRYSNGLAGARHAARSMIQAALLCSRSASGCSWLEQPYTAGGHYNSQVTKDQATS